MAAQHRACWRADPLAAPTPAVDAGSSERIGPHASPAQGRRDERRAERYAQVQALVALGLNLTEIGRRVHLSRKIVRKYARASSADAVSTRRTEQPASGTLGPYLVHLNRRWEEGCTNVAILLSEIRRQGYRGSRRTLSRYLTDRRRGAPPPQPRIVPPSPRVIAGWILRPVETLTTEEAAQLAQVCDRCPELATTRDLARQFTAVVRQRTGAPGYYAWYRAVQEANLPRLKSLAAGLRRDEDAVIAGLTLPWSSGVVEGTNTRIKLIKRQMYGRGSFRLLRRRVLLAS